MRRPLTPWTPAEIAAMAAVKPDDVSSARSLWRRFVLKRLAKLLDAGKR